MYRADQIQQLESEKGLGTKISPPAPLIPEKLPKLKQ
jgi:hypothetical protein